LTRIVGVVSFGNGQSSWPESVGVSGDHNESKGEIATFSFPAVFVLALPIYCDRKLFAEKIWGLGHYADCRHA
jgi:hypothetical protein